MEEAYALPICKLPPCPQELEGVLCYHRISRRSAQGGGGFQDRKPRHLHARRDLRVEEEERNAVGGGTGGYPREFPCPSCTPLAAGDKYGGMADGAAINS